MFKKNIIQQLISFIFPTTCICCDQIINYQGIFCINCFKKLLFISPIKCQVCSLPFKQQLIFDNQSKCAKCLAKKPKFDETYAIFIYNSEISKALTKFKYYDHLYLAKKFSYLLKNQFHSIISDADIICSVPMHPKKLRIRKFNQANIIAREIDKEKYLPELLLKVKNNQAQVYLSKNKRKKNLRNSFSLNNSLKNKINDKTIIIVDDVMTTGTTAHYCAKILKKNGAKKVIILIIARTVEESYSFNKKDLFKKLSTSTSNFIT
jgi:ComF family protein